MAVDVPEIKDLRKEDVKAIFSQIEVMLSYNEDLLVSTKLTPKNANTKKKNFSIRICHRVVFFRLKSTKKKYLYLYISTTKEISRRKIKKLVMDSKDGRCVFGIASLP